MGASASSISLKKKGPFLSMTDTDGQVQRVVHATGERIPMRKVFFKIDEIVSLSLRMDGNDVVMTLKNGTEFLLCGLEEGEEVYDFLQCKMIQEEDDEE